ncbi:cell division protein ZapE [Gordonia sp. CPCC 206044]|uniref:cell division protein ZapE n=1 Tax=Gordonia sp. CPCC 206044 TaxID=3140793 RepID=UPI003AF3FD87
MFRFGRATTHPTTTPASFSIAADRHGLTLDASQWRAVDALLGDRDVYLTGPAGRGKTWLLDTLADALPTDTVLRRHWHEFVRDLHVLIRRHGGLDRAVASLVADVRVFCFDEFHVDDPADGIFVRRLLDATAAAAVRVVVTSNLRPDQQMPNPLFHKDFAPTARMIETRFAVLDLDAGIDYRTLPGHRTGFASGQWLTSDTPLLQHLSSNMGVGVGGRSFTARQSTPERLWVDFAQICGMPLGATDYLDLAARHRRWIVDHIPDLAIAGREPAMRFVHLVDVLYDRDVPTMFVADVPRDMFGRNGRVPPGTARLLSRLRQVRENPAEW